MSAEAPSALLARALVTALGAREVRIPAPEPIAEPTFSPMNSMGASSRSPSPMTTVPSIGSMLSAARIASTAAWSAAFSSPRPIRVEAAIAAYEREGRRLVTTGRQVALVDAALRGERHVPRL